jgi:hypothetical protein
MNQISPLASQMPSFMAQTTRLNANAAAQANIQASFAVLSVKGKEWRVRYRGEDERLEETVTDSQGRQLNVKRAELEVVVVAVASAVSKTFYAEDWQDGQREAPDCSSVNGIVPDAGVRAKQSDTCALCPQNRFGSARTSASGKKGKACKDGRRIAVVPWGDLECDSYGGPIMLRLPTMSIGNFAQYCRRLEAFGADVTQVRTRLSFTDATHPEIMFQEAGWLESPDQYETIREHAGSDHVRRMLEDAAVPEATAPQSDTSSPLHAARPAFLPSSQPASPPPATPPQAQEPAPEPEPRLAHQATIAPRRKAAPFTQPQAAPSTSPPAGNGAIPVQPGDDMSAMIDSLIKLNNDASA